MKKRAGMDRRFTQTFVIHFSHHPEGLRDGLLWFIDGLE